VPRVTALVLVVVSGLVFLLVSGCGPRLIALRDQVPPLVASGTQAKLQTSVSAAYPAIAIKSKLQGSVRIRLRVDQDGSVASATVIRSARPPLEREALRAARACSFEPLGPGTKPYERVVTLIYNFVLIEK